MKRRWVVLGTCVAIALAVGFQQAEPLDELRKYGKVASGGWWLDGELHGRRFVAKDSSPTYFVNALEVLRKCPSVNRVAVPKSPELGTVLSRLAALDQIVAIELFDKDVADDDLAGLAGMKQLKFLKLSHNPRITDAGVAALAGLENLRYLDLTNTKVTGTGLKGRADMVSLEHLTLNDCPVTDESLAAIPRFPKLTHLFLGSTQVTDAGLMSLVGWHSLREVSWSDINTREGRRAFNEAFNAARRKARATGEWTDDYDRGPVFMSEPARRPQ
jgi:hypothetical protein